MDFTPVRTRASRWENHLLGLSGLVAALCFYSIWDTPGPRTEIPEVIIPLGISLGLSLYTVSLRRRNCTSERLERMAKHAWAGAVASSIIGGSWTVLHLHYGLPIDVLPDKILTLLSAGIMAGVLTGRSTGSEPQTAPPRSRPPRSRLRVVAETTWTDRPGPTPIFAAVTELLLELNEVDPLALDPLYEHIDPEIFADLRAQDGSPWQLLFFIDGYEVRICSYGTVTVYATELPNEPSPPVSPP